MILIQIMYSRFLLNHVHWRLLEVDRFFSMDDGVCGGGFLAKNKRFWFLYVHIKMTGERYSCYTWYGFQYIFLPVNVLESENKTNAHQRNKGDSCALHWAGGRRVFMSDQLPETKIKRVMFQYFIILYYNLQHSGSGCLFVLNVMSKFQCVIICCESEVRTSNMF